MRRLIWAAVLAVGAFTTLPSCHYDELVYICHSNDNCVVQGVQGYCLSAGAGASYCAFRDGKCSSGLRWDTTSPSAIDNNCVGLPDGGSID